jgi:hypothetical protein
MSDALTPKDQPVAVVPLPEARNFQELFDLAAKVLAHLAAMTGEWWRKNHFKPHPGGAFVQINPDAEAACHRNKAAQQYRDELRKQLHRLWHPGLPLSPATMTNATLDISDAIVPWLMRVLSMQGETSKVGNLNPATVRPRHKAMSLAEVKEKAEQIVRQIGKWPGYMALEKENMVGCSRGQLQKAVKESQYLKARLAETKGGRVRKPKAVALTDRIEATHGKDDEELQRLIEDQSQDDRTHQVRKNV